VNGVIVIAVRLISLLLERPHLQHAFEHRVLPATQQASLPS
jgi:hypothetical protein